MTLRAVIYARYSTEYPAGGFDCRPGATLEGTDRSRGLGTGPGVSGPGDQRRLPPSSWLPGSAGSRAQWRIRRSGCRGPGPAVPGSGGCSRIAQAYEVRGYPDPDFRRREISERDVGLKGTMNALFLKDLADKTRRGLRGRVEAGKSAGGLCYGYKAVHQLDERGERIRGERRIDPDEAAVVVRIFQMFAAGASPVAIARTLNAEGIPGPGGQAWRDTTIRGHALRGTGILRNELHVGRLIWNRMRYIKDPTTGKRVSRINPKELWIEHEVPEMRLLDEDLWDRVQSRLGAIREASGANSPERPRFWENRRAQHLLSGKILVAAVAEPWQRLVRTISRATRLAGSVCAPTGALFPPGARESDPPCPPDRAHATRARSRLRFRIHRGMEPMPGGPRRDPGWAGARTRPGRTQACRDYRGDRRRLARVGPQARLDALESQQAALERQLAEAVPAVPRLHPV